MRRKSGREKGNQQPQEIKGLRDNGSILRCVGGDGGEGRERERCLLVGPDAAVWGLQEVRKEGGGCDDVVDGGKETQGHPAAI